MILSFGLGNFDSEAHPLSSSDFPFIPFGFFYSETLERYYVGIVRLKRLVEGLQEKLISRIYLIPELGLINSNIKIDLNTLKKFQILVITILLAQIMSDSIFTKN